MPYSMLNEETDREPVCALLWSVILGFYVFVVYTSWSGPYFSDMEGTMCRVRPRPRADYFEGNGATCEVAEGVCAGAATECGQEIAAAIYQNLSIPSHVTCYVSASSCEVVPRMRLRKDMTHAGGGLAGGVAVGFSPLIALLQVCLLASVARDFWSRSTSWEWMYIRVVVVADMILPFVAWGIRLRMSQDEVNRAEALKALPASQCRITTLGTDETGRLNMMGPYVGASSRGPYECPAVRLYMQGDPVPPIARGLEYCFVKPDCSDADLAAFDVSGEHRSVVLWTVCIIAFALALLSWCGWNLYTVLCNTGSADKAAADTGHEMDMHCAIMPLVPAPFVPSPEDGLDAFDCADGERDCERGSGGSDGAATPHTNAVAPPPVPVE